MKLVRKPLFEFWKRLGGLCLSATVFLVFTLPGISLVLNPKAGHISWGDSPLPPGSVRWDMIGFGLIALVSGYTLLMRPQRSVEMLFSADKSKLQDETTRKIWTLYTQVGGAVFLVWTLLPISAFIQSLR